MNRIILLENLTEANEAKLQALMEETYFKYRISLKDQCLIIDGTSDDLYQVKQLIQDEGYKIK